MSYAKYPGKAFWCLQPHQGFLLLENAKKNRQKGWLWIKAELILINMLSPTFVPNLVTSLKNEFRNAKRGRLIKWSIMRIFNEAEPPWSNLSEILG